MKKIVHVISHSHWDREWYLPLINHQMRLVDLIDGIIEASKDNKFVSFQMDGQFLPIEDYLNIKPQNREIVYKLIREGKIIVGPWYILQDSFLTSGESNVRNLEIGIRKSKELGVPAMIGYFPDTFGNIGQAPQILKKANIHNAYFGRGVKATGFANVVFEDYTSKNSEMYWKSPDGSKVLSVLFANWYCNGVDMPSDPQLLKNYLDRKISDMEKFASTRHLLLMNGCDHSPVQKNIGEIISTANSLYDEYEFIHSNLEDYYKAVNSEVNPENLNVIEGELRSQTTDGWGTLQGTSSSRYDLKYMNKNVEMRLEEVIQPLYTMFFEPKDYPAEKIDFIYRHLLSNHPHDSICGCSIDSVHNGNVRRFKDCLEALDYLELEAKNYLRSNLENNYEEDYVFTVINTTPYHQRKEAKVLIDYDKRMWTGAEYKEIVKELEKVKISNLQVIDDKKSYETYIKDLGVNFGYELPKSSFRKPYYSRQILVKFMCELDPFERRIFRLKEMPDYIGKANLIDTNVLETDYFKIRVENNATLTILDKRNNKEYRNVLMLEDSGDIGNEYIYKQSSDNEVIKSSRMLGFSVEEETTKRYTIRIKESITVPESADISLDKEQKDLVDIRYRKSKRSDKTKELTVYKKISIDKLTPTIKIRLELENNVKDHRLRLLFGHDLNTENVWAESIFEVVKRPANPPKTWTNPDYSQNLNRFVQMKDEQGGFTVSTIGVQEYENKEEGLYLTLFRAVGEMGDWGYFPTKDSQMQIPMRFNFFLDFFVSDYYSSQQRVIGSRLDYFTTQIDKTEGNIKPNVNYEINVGSNIFSTLYRNFRGERIIRLYNPDGKTHRLGEIKGTICDIIGDEALENQDYSRSHLEPFEIRTIKWEE
ncbi:MAG: glycoside hydrolase family 38 C-terminal domain-containing protein [Tissierellia bacterium]|nr:glycoside hydrolase family 38 C-terminal domain-containing protein [Tissierellia bacterium]